MELLEFLLHPLALQDAVGADVLEVVEGHSAENLIELWSSGAPGLGAPQLHDVLDAHVHTTDLGLLATDKGSNLAKLLLVNVRIEFVYQCLTSWRGEVRYQFPG